jgi:hypothetical protein
MFVGDVLGTLLVLWLAAVAVKVIRPKFKGLTN